jgi:hypothetical protein
MHQKAFREISVWRACLQVENINAFIYARLARKRDPSGPVEQLVPYC